MVRRVVKHCLVGGWTLSIMVGKLEVFRLPFGSKFRAELLYRQGHSDCLGLLVFCLLVCTFFYLAAASSPVNATTYYLDAVNGNDSNPGTSTLPWKTIDRTKISSAATPKVNPGDTIVLKSGNYGEWIWRASDNFTNTSDWITYKADTDANTVFNELNWSNAKEVHIKLEGIKFICAGYGQNQDSGGYTVVFNNIKYVDMNHCYIRGAGDTEWYGSGIKLTTGSLPNICEHITIRNSEIYDCETGFGFSQVNDVNIDNCEIHHTANDLISGANMSNSTITRCYLHDAEPCYEFRLEDGDNTVSGTFQ